jgi:hypothetical protein
MVILCRESHWCPSSHVHHVHQDGHKKYLLALGLPLLWIVTQNGFQVPILRQSKFFSHQAYGNEKCLIANLATTESFQSPSDRPPPLDGDWNFSIVQESTRRGGSFFFFFFKNDITYTPPHFRGPKNFSRHSTYPHYQTTIKNFNCWNEWGMCYHFGEKKNHLCFPY